MAETTTLVLVVLTMVVLAALTWAAVRFTRSALEGPEDVDGSDHGTERNGGGPGLA